MLSNRTFCIIKNIPSVLRLCHNGSTDQFGLQNLQVIKTFDKTVDPYSKIYIETPMHVKIRPIDLHQHPNGDRLILSLLSRKDESPPEFTVKQSAKRVDFIGNQTPSSEAVCVIQAPIRASFDIHGTGDSSISIDKMHSDECSLKTELGSVKLKDLKGKNIQVRSDQGSVSCEGTILAENIEIRTDASAEVTCEHIRANNLKISTSAGNISTESCYSDESHFSTLIGSLKLGNIHRNCLVEILKKGELTMTGFDGTIKAILKSGNVHIQASRLLDKNSIFVHESGLVDIRVPESFAEMCLIEVIANKLNLEEQIMKCGKLLEDPLHKKFRYGEDSLNEKLNELYVDCRNGSVEVRISSWQKMLEGKGINLIKK